MLASGTRARYPAAMPVTTLQPLPSLLPGEDARREFPIFLRDWKRRLAYLDTAASSQKPRCVINRISCFYSEEHSNIHRGAYSLSAQATDRYEEARATTARFIGAPSPGNIVFTRGTTEGINLVARAYEKFFSPGDRVVLTLLEHHSNIVPWQLLAQRKKLKLIFADVDAHGQLDCQNLASIIRKERPKLVACTHISNALGTIVPVKDIVGLAHESGAKILIDAAQSIAHSVLNVQELDVDFLVFSGHKIYGPTGIGGLYAKAELLAEMDPFLGGGDMIREVTVDGSTWADAPAKFEAGTPPIAEAVAMGTAIEFIDSIGLERISAHEHKLFENAYELLSREPGITLYGPVTAGLSQASILSFNLDGVHSHDLSTIADSFNVQFRAGHHCAMPLLKRLNIGSSARISFGVYSTAEDLPPLIEAIRYAKKLFSS